MSPTRSVWGWVLLAVLVVMGGQSARAAAPATWELDADRLVHHRQEPRWVEAEGAVVLSRPPELGEPLTIRADWMRYYPDLEMVEARGEVVIDSPGEHTEAATASLHLPGRTGTLTSATIFLSEHELYIRGSEIEKTGVDTYELQDAWFSACDPEAEPCPAWSFASRRASIEVEGMARLYHPTFRVREKPLLYSPYLLLPVKTKRQSGFLFPEWSYASQQGMGFDLPYFWNISPSADLTFYPRYYTQRGLLAGVEFNYAAAENSRGMLVASFLGDRRDDPADDPFRDDGQLRQTSNRYWLRGKIDHDFGDDLVGRLDLDLVSDQDFIQEFDAGPIGYDALDQEFDRRFGRDLQEASLPTRQSTLQLNKGYRDMVLSGELSIQQDSHHQKPAVSSLQALPRLGLAGRTPLLGRRTSLAWDSEYVHYWRSRGIAAHRLDLHPQVITPLPRAGGWLEGRLTVGGRQTMYQVTDHGDYRWQEDRYQDRQAVDLEANLATTLVRDFALPGSAPKDSGGGRRWLEHMIRPNLIYTYTDHSSQQHLPDLDSVDNLKRRNWLTYEFNNYLELAGLASPAADGTPGDFYSRSLAFLQVAQTY
ncbi:MAG: LPS assembly protein LptD [Desulfurivibrio sp.]|nr:LPS assembly protein LptD [Desulfurivibrio sp.]